MLVANAARLGLGLGLGSGLDKDEYLALTDEVRERTSKVVAYNSSMRMSVASSILNAMEIYVHSDEKVEKYRVANPKDAVQKVLDTCKNQTDLEFQLDLYRIFKGFRDLHTQHRFPGPRKCYSYFQPISFTLLEDDLLVLSSTHNDPQVLEMIDPSILAQLTVGDQVVLVNGHPWKDFIKATAANETQGATAAAVLRYGIDYLSVRSGDVFLAPAGNNMTFTLKSIEDERVKSVTIPWTVVGDSYCLKENTFMEIAVPVVVDEHQEERFTPRNRQRELVHKSFLSPAPSSSFKMNSTSSPIIKWALLNLESLPASTTVGILKILSFIDDETTVVSLVQSLLANELNQTSMVIVDVRDNPGGSILLADALPQLFSATPIQPTLYRALVNPINQYLFLNATPPADPWHQAYQEKMPLNSTFTPFVSFSNFSHANAIGRVYFNPVSVLTNAHCYSACEMFTATMQDWANVTIVGEDESTGGGGANVISYSSLTRKYPSKFPKLPYSGKGYVGESISVAWRQALRRDFSLLEDVGVKSDLQIRLALKEFLDGIHGGQEIMYRKVAVNLSNSMLFHNHLES